jgi:hypothetical protein
MNRNLGFGLRPKTPITPRPHRPCRFRAVQSSSFRQPISGGAVEQFNDQVCSALQYHCSEPRLMQEPAQCLYGTPTGSVTDGGTSLGGRDGCANVGDDSMANPKNRQNPVRRLRVSKSIILNDRYAGAHRRQV